MKKISLEQLLRESRAETYREQYQYVCELIEKGRILPVKSSPLNGKKPALHQNYWLVEDVPDYKELIEELKFHILPVIRTDYYMNHPEVYQEERKWVRLLNCYFSGQSMGDVSVHGETVATADAVEALGFVKETGTVKSQSLVGETGTVELQSSVEEMGIVKPQSFVEAEGFMEHGYVSLNERSFQIWGREKFLQREQGRKILVHCGVKLEQLHVYDTTEPLACYSASRRIPQNVLILENKDTFYSMRRHLMNANDQKNASKSCDMGDSVHSGQIFGTEIGTLVYGAGKGILRSYEDFRFCVEPHINDPKNQILYFGDLDYEGIGIYERLAVLFDDEDGVRDSHIAVHKVRPFVQAYEKMVEKAEACGMDFLPKTSEKQNRNISGAFFSYFSRQMADKMCRILEAGKYIPQEIINIMDF